MQSIALTPEHYLGTLPEDRKQAIQELRNTIKQNLPPGFTEVMSSGMIGYVVPLSLYPSGYHCNPQLPLPFINIASQKNFIAVYHMGLYANPDLLNWFKSAYTKQVKTKLDMGKSCIRFKKVDQIPYGLIGELAAKIPPQQWIETYERQVKR
ncbi:DUF1801 domain-containing protein [Adhaeribacter radiodurans]|uniref:DUF1801 domain-containing protein n=1 Tax=Adhaeribacter radiodurans TaxID=2745197 RepID=A0A7L7LC26_9BACT|nr:DUF1801 domain-containing protein [Adhaeribacter radiodurans]QMU30085.1 DUF1801 domain-containing protein [Adhaeribacter radiodurans]